MLTLWTALNYCLHNSTHWHTWPFRIKYSREPYNNVWWILIRVLEPKTAWQDKDIQALFFSNDSPLRRLLKLGGMQSRAESGILALQREGLKNICGNQAHSDESHYCSPLPPAQFFSTWKKCQTPKENDLQDRGLITFAYVIFSSHFNMPKYIHKPSQIFAHKASSVSLIKYSVKKIQGCKLNFL